MSRARVALAAAVAAVVASGCVAAPAPWTGDSPSGAIDEVTFSGDRLQVRGWAADRNTTSPIDVVVYVDGKLQAGVATANSRRPDVWAATARSGRSGFDRTWEVPGVSTRSSVCVTAINAGPGAHSVLGCVNPTQRVLTQVPPTTAPPTTTTPPTTTVPGPDCAAPAAPNVDWSGCDLSGRDLSGADLSGANLEDANLTGALLSDATLDRVVLDGANLTGVDAERVSATDASMVATHVTAADFDGSTFTRVGMEHVQLIGSSFVGVTWVQVDADFAAILVTDLTGSRIEFSSLRGVVFTAAKLDNATVSFSDFYGAIPFETNAPGSTWFSNTCMGGEPALDTACFGVDTPGGAPGAPGG